MPTSVVMSCGVPGRGVQPDARREVGALRGAAGDHVGFDHPLEVVHRDRREQRDVDRVVEMMVADDDVGDVFRADAELPERAEDQLAVGDHARVDDDDATGVPDKAHRPGDVGHPGVSLDEDVQAGGARQFAHPANGSGDIPGRPRRRV